MVTPSWAVTTVVMVLGPTVKGRFCEALPEITAIPFTVMVAPGSAAVGVTVIDVTPFTTLAV